MKQTRRSHSAATVRIAARRVFAWCLAGAVLIVAALPQRAEGADFTLLPSLTLSEEVNDNILLSPDVPKKEYITRAVPAVLLHYQTPFWLWDAAYSRDYRHFERGTISDDVANTLHLRNRTQVLDDFLLLEVSDDIARTSLDITRDFTAQSPVVNQAERTVFSANPYFLVRPSSNSTLSLGHIYQTTRFSDNAGIDRIDNTTYLQTKLDVSSRLTVTTGVRYTQNTNVVQDFSQTDAFMTSRYAYAENCYLFLTLGKMWFNAGKTKEVSQTFFDVGIVHRYSTKNRINQLYWDLGLTHRFPEFDLSLESAVLFVEDPGRVLTREDLYQATVSRETIRAFFSISSALREYKDLEFKTLLARSIDAQGSLRYRLTQRTTGAISGSFQRLTDQVIQSTTDTSLAVGRLEYRLSARTTSAFEYRHVKSHSAETAVNNYRNNREIVELMIRF